MTGEVYYLSSLDSVRFEPVRECRFERLLTFDSGKVAAEARLSPAVIGQDFGRGDDVDTVILAPRHEGDRSTPSPSSPASCSSRTLVNLAIRSRARCVRAISGSSDGENCIGRARKRSITDLTDAGRADALRSGGRAFRRALMTLVREGLRTLGVDDIETHPDSEWGPKRS